MPRYPEYRFATEFQRHGRPIDQEKAVTFLRVVRDTAGLLRAVLHPSSGAAETEKWNEQSALTHASDALEAKAEHPADEDLQKERLLVAAYHRICHDVTTPYNVYVPENLRPWAARIKLADQHVLLYVQAATETGARYGAIEECRLLISNQTDATFNRMS